MTDGPISRFLRHHYRHFNAATVIDAADGYKRHLDGGGAMLVTLAGAMSTAELGISAASDDPARSAARVSVVSSIGYVAFLAGPPVLGTLADRVGIVAELLRGGERRLGARLRRLRPAREPLQIEAVPAITTCCSNSPRVGK